jgi:predicted secreted protein
LTIAFAVALYFMIWWLTLFAVLPFGVRTQEEDGDIVPGTPASAPTRFMLVRIFAINTAIAAVAFAVVWYALQSELIAPNVPVSTAPGASPPYP